MHPALARVSAAIPDTVTAAMYATAWIAPQRLGVATVHNLLAAVVIEFLVLHATALYGFGVRRAGAGTRGRMLALAGVTVPYLIAAVGLAIGLESPWLVVSFLWLFTARFAFLLFAPAASAAAEVARTKTLWLVSLAAYIAGIIACTRLPLPALGLTPEFVATLSLSGHADPNAQPPQGTIAFGFLYFLVMAATKALLAGGASRADRAAAM